MKLDRVQFRPDYETIGFACSEVDSSTHSIKVTDAGILVRSNNWPGPAGDEPAYLYPREACVITVDNEELLTAERKPQKK